MGRKLGETLTPTWRAIKKACETAQPLLVPVPLHPLRERERGFNQAAALTLGLSLELARRAEAPPARVETRCLRRIRATVPQTGLSPAARQENVRGVFVVASLELVRGREVILVDDVMTTGATLSACAGALKRAGAQRVLAMTLARASPRFPDDHSLASSLPVDEFGGERT